MRAYCREARKLTLLRKVLPFERVDANAQGVKLRRTARFDYAYAALQCRAPQDPAHLER
jgi:hypothetical protein